jgi:hypothetical protein
MEESSKPETENRKIGFTAETQRALRKSRIQTEAERNP